MSEIVEWLRSCSGVISARPVKVTIGKQTWEGALYVVQKTYQPTERAVTEGRVKAGEEYTEPRLYLLGELPKTRKKTCYPWISLPSVWSFLLNARLDCSFLRLLQGPQDRQF